jgi:GT2 family glycosyltransferase
MTDVIAGVVVVHFGGPEQTLSCLDSVMGEGSLTNRRVVVVDNSDNLDRGSLDDEIRLLTCPDNPGFGSAANLGIATIDPDRDCSIYLILNNDATLSKGFLDVAADALETGVGAAGGPILQPGTPQPAWYAGGRINFLTGTA